MYSCQIYSLWTLLPFVSLKSGCGLVVPGHPCFRADDQWHALGVLSLGRLGASTWSCWMVTFDQPASFKSVSGGGVTPEWTLDFVMFATVSIHNCLLHRNMLKEHHDVEIFVCHFLLRTSDPFEFGHLRVAGSLEISPIQDVWVWIHPPKENGGVRYTRNQNFHLQIWNTWHPYHQRTV